MIFRMLSLHIKELCFSTRSNVQNESKWKNQGILWPSEPAEFVGFGAWSMVTQGGFSSLQLWLWTLRVWVKNWVPQWYQWADSRQGQGQGPRSRLCRWSRVAKLKFLPVNPCRWWLWSWMFGQIGGTIRRKLWIFWKCKESCQCQMRF